MAMQPESKDAAIKANREVTRKVSCGQGEDH
jgi:hypothetical protein